MFSCWNVCKICGDFDVSLSAETVSGDTLLSHEDQIEERSISDLLMMDSNGNKPFVSIIDATSDK